MGRLDEYIQEVFKWNQEMRAFLESEDTEGKSELWNKLERLTDIMEGIKSPQSIEELSVLQNHVDELHSDLEKYFHERQQIGTIYMHEPNVAAGNHTLPPLPYPYNALEPYISEEIMRLHHDKHHKSYVDGLNKAETALHEARKTGDFSLVKHWSRELAFHGSGHYLHTIFWSNMKPKGGGKPSGGLLKEIEKYFGGFESFKKHFSEAAKGVEGVGWAILVWSPRSRHLEILQSERHMILTQWDTIPLLVLDVWEHAYYLQYKNNRGDYVNNWWNLVNWKNVEERFRIASELKWKPY
ncbi:superoxide dismutase [Bacillus sp. DTU_2020_1000418_1_SI_GHA_SEK_038]|uniref:superoxide dismutase n=1 Tax=Bacillus sp. DTU_2020_1000418_1_SI_GHA_SEK_038 TaxID=3077585 RepID=UPI0028E5CFBD|nr:superoxide dismutase [Bacillus sp. DTU_2020_1000418_1_SI_GHA_SEK_038]WNS74089.1 superoxide dismutase [Bacillus sp. DTU_2020_1000418_1_SI_GHA_SEK_038]